MDGRGRAFDNIFVERLWRSVKHEDVYLNGYSAMGELLVGLSKYIAFYNGERPHKGLDYQTPNAVYASGVGGGAVIVDKYPAVQGLPIALRSTGTALQAGHIENVADTEDQNPGQRRPAVCEISANLN